jgi:hypothetical protein
MNKILTVAVLAMVAVAVVTPPAGAAGQFFNSAEKNEIQRVVAEVLPGCRADFGCTDQGTGIIVGTCHKNLLYFYIKKDGEMIVGNPPAKLKKTLEKIGGKIYAIMDRWPAARFLAPGPKELRGGK